MKKCTITVLLFFSLSKSICAQVDKPAATYPQIKGFVSILHPIVTFDKNTNAFNFTKKLGYTVSVPMAILVFKSDKIGYSFEVAPVIKAVNNVSKVTNLVFDPGAIFRLKHGCNVITRAAFETSGRYGFTPVFAKTIIKRPNVSYFIDTAAPVRFGNGSPPSVALIFQFGAIF